MARNCEGRPDLVGPTFDWAPELHRCPWATIEPEAWDLVHLWKEWSLVGALPFEGELVDQPQWVVELLALAQAASEQARSTKEQVTMARLLEAARAAGQR